MSLMAFGDNDLRKELFKKVGTEAIKDPLERLKLGEKEIVAGNHVKGKEIIKSVIDLTGANARRYEEQKQHRSAAEQYYIQALAYEKFENTDERDLNYSKVVDSLLAASKTAINFGEDNRGITAVTLAGLVCLMFGNEKHAFEIYNEGVMVSEQKPNSDSLKKLLFSLGYLLDGLRNTNIGALTDAQNFISTDLKPMLKTSKLLGFTTLLDTVVSHTRGILESRIRMPKMQIGTQIPRDMLFNTPYDIIINIANSGKGEATDLVLEIAIPEDIEVLEGKKKEALGDVVPNTDIERSFTIRLLTGEGYEEIRKLTGHVTYKDMLQNSHKQSLGTLDLEFRAVSKASEYNDKLKAAINVFAQTESKIITEIPTSFRSAITLLGKTLENNIASSIKAEEFNITEFGLALFESTTKWVDDVVGTGQTAKHIIDEIKQMINTEKSNLAEELMQKYNSEKENALASLKSEIIQEKEAEIERINSTFQNKIEEAINKVKMSLENQFKEEKAQLKDEYAKELHNQQQASENKIRQLLAQQENTLKNEFNVDMQKKNDEIESAIRELQTQQVQEISKVKENIYEELTKKYQEEIEMLKYEYNEEKRKLEEAEKGVMEAELNNLKTKLLQEKEEALESLTREMEIKHQQEIAEKIDNLQSTHSYILREKDAKIQELETKLRDFTSSVEPL